MLGALRESGGRITTGRRAIVEALVRVSGHVTAEDLISEIQASNPDLHLSTVYRTLEILEDTGLVEHVHFGHGAAYWHLASDHRHHLVCAGCGGVTHVPADVFTALQGELAQRYGFRLDVRHFATQGRCRDCADE